jgi:DNA-binding SARP family transcriptional activator
MTTKSMDRLIDRPETEALGCGPVVCLLGGPYLVVDGHRSGVPEGCQRLLAFLAMNGGRVLRRRAAGLLWPEVEEERAAGNLRSALWRLRASGADVVKSDKSAVWLHPDADTDVDSVHDWAARLVGGRPLPDDLHTVWWHPEVVDLLPGWYDEWIVFARERLRQQVLHALECLSALLVREGRYADGIEAALLAVEIEPLRESAQRRLIEAHLAEGNAAEAHRALRTYGGLLRRDLGIRPSAGLVALVPGWSSAVGRSAIDR